MENTEAAGPTEHAAMSKMETPPHLPTGHIGVGSQDPSADDVPPPAQAPTSPATQTQANANPTPDDELGLVGREESGIQGDTRAGVRGDEPHLPGQLDETDDPATRTHL